MGLTWAQTIRALFVLHYSHIRRLTAKAGDLWSQRNWGRCTKTTRPSIYIQNSTAQRVGFPLSLGDFEGLQVVSEKTPQPFLSTPADAYYYQ